jgi:hypothetical protein
MKRVILFTATCVALGAGAYFLTPATQRQPEPIVVIAPASPTPAPEMTELRTNQDGEEVFRRAFWREPAANDRILHAERREWVSEKDGVRRWQWFIAVEPGPEFAAWLREQNPFGLQSGAADRGKNSETVNPGWFPAVATLRDGELRQTADGGMTVITKGGVIYATDVGHGFAVATRSAPAPANRPAALPLEAHRPLRARPPETASN